MTTKYSFSSIEKNLLHEYREKINKSEDSVDLSNVFAKTATNFMCEVFQGKIEVKDNDCIFDPESEAFFKFSNKLMETNEFVETLNNSDLKNVIERFADTAKHRFLHLKKNPKNQVLK